jgi:hypothetical protein
VATDFNGVVVGPTPPGIPHFAVPFYVADDGAVGTVQQDTETEIIQSVAMLCGTVPGTRLVVPAYGLTDPTFAGINPTELQVQVSRFEERATSVTVVYTPANQELVAVEVAGGKG